MSPIDRELEKTFARRAETMSPPADLYAGVERRATRIRRQRTGAVAGAALTILALVIAVPLARDAGKNDVGFAPPGPSDPPAPVVTTAPPQATTAPAVPRERVPVYYARDTGPKRGIRLYREFHLLPAKTIEAAVAEMLGVAPIDPDYRTLWPAGTTVRGVTVEGDLATVDLSEGARRNSIGSEGAEAAVQQLVYTVTATDNDVKRVLILVEGQPVSELWGAVDTSKPIARASHLGLLGSIWVLTPENGGAMGRIFLLSGEAIVFEAHLNWRVENAATGEEIVSGYTMTEGGDRRSKFSQPITIPASVPDGTRLTVIAFEASAEDGSEQEPDSKVVTLRG